MRLLITLLAFPMLAFAAAPFGVAHIDRTQRGASQYPIAVHLEKVGTYPGETKSGAGYFYDEVLEYRVWFHPERGAAHITGDEDYFAAFAQYEAAATYARTTPGAEVPLVLVLQRESINEPTPGQYVVDRDERITEWQIRWLRGSKRTPASIQQFMAHPRPPNQ
jgi:hypothetical protein